MKPQIWTDPLRDIQQLPPAAWCRRCRGELYAPAPDGLCPRCRRERRGQGGVRPQTAGEGARP